MSNEKQRMEDVHSPREALRWVVETYGVEKLEAGIQVSNMLGDLLPGDETARKRYSLALTAGVGKDVVRIYRSRNGRLDQYDAQELRNSIASGCCFDQAFTEELVDAFLFAVTGIGTKRAPVLMKTSCSVVALEKNVPKKRKCNVEPLSEDQQYVADELASWRDIADVFTTEKVILGLKKDGTVKAIGKASNVNEFADWTNIREIVSDVGVTRPKSFPFFPINAGCLILGIQQDGRVSAVNTVGINDPLLNLCRENAAACAVHYMQKYVLLKNGRVADRDGSFSVLKWNGIQSITAGPGWIAGLKKNGTVVVSQDREKTYPEIYQAVRKASAWRGVTAIASGGRHLLGLLQDGTVVACGADTLNECEVQDWKDVTAVWASIYNSYGLKSDGTVLHAGANTPDTEWKNVERVVIASRETSPDEDKGKDWQPGKIKSDAIAIRKDGTILFSGDAWSDQMQARMEQMTGVLKAAAGQHHLVALKKDGTVSFACEEKFHWYSPESV